ncbi:MAG: YggS family pyridoxal phosphate-dependent enzyme [Rhodoluna sp.]|nr:YggS family pyridoxal phosphate-dependent enzyme [Rhodoluna sp.]
MQSNLAERLQSIQQRIDGAAKAASRSKSEIELVIVTKNHGFELALELLALGENQFGENRDQEASAKAAQVSQSLAPGELAPTWHFVGQLQTNKVKSMLTYTSVLHSLDRLSLLKELEKQLVKTPEATLDAFIELNLTDDPNRGGIELKNLLEFAEQVLKVSQIRLLGVMGVAGLGVEPAVDFATILSSSEKLQSISASSKYISAGMSGDFETAIGFGATHLRIGTAITGNR